MNHITMQRKTHCATTTPTPAIALATTPTPTHTTLTALRPPRPPGRRRRCWATTTATQPRLHRHSARQRYEPTLLTTCTTDGPLSSRRRGHEAVRRARFHGSHQRHCCASSTPPAFRAFGPFYLPCTPQNAPHTHTFNTRTPFRCNLTLQSRPRPCGYDLVPSISAQPHTLTQHSYAHAMRSARRDRCREFVQSSDHDANNASAQPHAYEGRTTRTHRDEAEQTGANKASVPPHPRCCRDDIQQRQDLDSSVFAPLRH